VKVHLCIIKQSDLYPAAHFRLALFFSFVVMMITYFSPFHWEDPIWLLYVQLPAIVLGYFLGYSKKLKSLFTTKSEKKEETTQKALEVATRAGWPGLENSIFIFASLLEKRLEVFATPEIKDFITDAEMNIIIKEAKKDLKKGQPKNILEKMKVDLENKLGNLIPNKDTVLLKSELQEDHPQKPELTEECEKVEKVDESPKSPEVH